MIPLWMLYAVLVGALLGMAAVAGERLLRHRRRPARGVWLAALAGSVTLPVVGWLTAGSGGSAGGAVRRWLLGPAGGSGAGSDAGEAGPSGLLGAPEVLGDWLPAPAGGLAAVLGPLETPLLVGWAVLSLLLAGSVVGTAAALRRRARAWGEARVHGDRVLVSPDTGPAVLGVWRPRVVLPSWALALGRRSLEVVLLHEREHVEGRDTWLINGALVAVVLMPWNPALWWQLRRLRLAVEVDCDRRVLDRGVPPRRYGDVLLEVEGRMGGTALHALGLGNPTTSLRRRFEMMRSDDAGTRGWKVGLAAFVALAAVAVACEAPLPTLDEEPQPEAAADALAEEPTFTPHTVAPEVRNREEVARALQLAYPDHLRSDGVGGDVVMHFFLQEDGQVGNVLIDRPSEHEELNEAALEVADAFEFSPAYNHGERVPVWISLPIRFDPEG